MRAICFTLLAAAILVQSGVLQPASAQGRRRGAFGDDCNQQWSSRRERVCETRTYTMPGGAPLDVDAGPNGGVLVRAANRADVSVEARIVTDAGSEAEARARAAEVQVTASGGRVTATGPQRSDDGSWSVSFLIEVPQATPVTLSARNGPVALEDYTGQARLHAVNGPLRLVNVGGDIKGETTNGPVTVELEGIGWQGTGLDVETRNGPVRMRVPEDYSAQLELSTVNGPIAVSHPGIPQPVFTRRGRRQPSGPFRATLGGGGPLVRATTVNGPVSVAVR
jgi:hypothetical protein